MKHLKTYKLFEDFETTESSTDRELIMENIKDILIPLADHNLICDVGQDPGVPSIFKKSNKDDRRILIDIYHNKIWIEFNINDIADELLHLLSYSKDIKMSMSLDVEVENDGKYVTKKVKGYDDSKFITVGGDVVKGVRHVSIRLHPDL